MRRFSTLLVWRQKFPWIRSGTCDLHLLSSCDCACGAGNPPREGLLLALVASRGPEDQHAFPRWTHISQVWARESPLNIHSLIFSSCWLLSPSGGRAIALEWAVGLISPWNVNLAPQEIEALFLHNVPCTWIPEVPGQVSPKINRSNTKKPEFRLHS